MGFNLYNVMHACHANFMHLWQVVLREDCNIFLYISLIQTQDAVLAILVEGQLSNIPMKFE